MKNIILTSSFGKIADELVQKNLLPAAPCKVVFVTTAGNPYDATPWIQNDRNALVRLGYETMDLDIQRSSSDEIEDVLGDAVTVPGV